MTTYIKGFKVKNSEEIYKLEDALSANTSIYAESAGFATRATTADSVDSIGNVTKYSGLYEGKQREGLRFTNNSGEGSEALIELNSKGNFAIESLTKHVNIESKKGIQIKPTTTLTLDSTRRIIAGKGNEIQVEARFDDYGDVTGYSGADEEWAELKINSRNLDLRCHEHGGIALQIAGKDKNGNENKIKFESDRTNSISESGTYSGEGGKGVEFGTFNNLHSSLYTGDYRFRGNGTVYGVLRETPVQTETGKIDYQTQDDDFKDPINESTPSATWNQIINAANKCKDKETIASEAYVLGEIARAQLPESEVDTSQFATTGYVQEYVAEHGGSGGGNLTAGSGIHIEDNTISVNNYSNIEPLTALTKDVNALKSIEYSKQGNLRMENKGDFAFEALTDAPDENGNVVLKGDKVQSENYAYYEADDAYFYKAKVDAEFYDGTSAPKGTIVFMKDVKENAEELAYYDNPDYYYKAKYATVDYNGNEVPEKGMVYKSSMTGGEEEEAFYQDKKKYGYKCLIDGALDENGNAHAKKEIIDISSITNEKFYKNNGTEWEKIVTWERVDIWEKSAIWERNSCNLNIETDSKIKLLGDKLEIYKDDNEDTEEMDPMRNITICSEELIPYINAISFERSVSKNGVETGCDPIISFTYKNNVKDVTKVPDFEAFKTGWNTKHTISRTDEELMEIYERLLEEPTIPSSTVRLSTLLGLVARVNALEETVANLVSRIETLESKSNPE